MINLRPSKAEELPQFAEMEAAEDTAEFVFGWDADRHSIEFAKDEVIYLSIYSHDELAGFFILAIEPDEKTIEFRRIVVSQKGRGVGQAAINAMEEYCRSKLGRTSIWLDVLESNERGIHIYEKLGYRFFKKSEQEGKALLFYNKQLSGS